jgi:Na+/proline symporter
MAGIALVVLGFVGLLWGGIPYKKTENVAQIGDLKMQVTEKKEMTIPPWISGMAILAGAALLLKGGKPAS